MENTSCATRGELRREPWNKRKIVGQKAPMAYGTTRSRVQKRR